MTCPRKDSRTVSGPGLLLFAMDPMASLPLGGGSSLLESHAEKAGNILGNRIKGLSLPIAGPGTTSQDLSTLEIGRKAAGQGLSALSGPTSHFTAKILRCPFLCWDEIYRYYNTPTHMIRNQHTALTIRKKRSERKTVGGQATHSFV